MDIARKSAKIATLLLHTADEWRVCPYELYGVMDGSDSQREEVDPVNGQGGGSFMKNLLFLLRQIAALFLDIFPRIDVPEPHLHILIFELVDGGVMFELDVFGFPHLSALQLLVDRRLESVDDFAAGTF